ncbi:MAG: 3-hydroxyacyl-CoA dehydrogenase family protein [Bacteroidota bacterium]|nr:3-hydroxyacyl-CoA dehydrogenase family protein [Bacteroidota bacterium]
MKVIVVANVDQRDEILLKNTKAGIELVFLAGLTEAIDQQNYDAFFFLSGEMDDIINYQISDKPVFINSVTETLPQNNLPANYSRINGWPGFLQRQIWEAASEDKIETSRIFDALGWKFIFVNDEPGFISGRVISMIINEAFFALEDGVSTEKEIDLAMKLGTNYPFGPFEWSEKIGLTNVYVLLKTLALEDTRYIPAPLLEKRFADLTSSATK